MVRGRPLRVQILALVDCTALVPVGLADLLRKSNELSASLPGAARRRGIEVSLISPTKKLSVRSAGGVTLRTDARLADTVRADVVVVPALDPEVLVSLRKNQPIVDWLKIAYERGADVVSACTGAFALAEAGLLDRRKATTHWAFQAQFSQRYPRVTVLPEAIIVDQGRIVTAGGATSFVNLAHFLVEKHLGEECARAASRMFLIDPNKAPQSAYAVFSSQKKHQDDAILRAQDTIERNPGGAPSIEALAQQVALSKRTFARRFVAATGNTPKDYVQRVRVEAAKRSLEVGKSVAEVSSAVGYGDPVAFRKTFVRITGLTPADYRQRYGPRLWTV